MTKQHGDKGQCGCHNCRTIADTTWKIGSIEMYGIEVDALMLAYCDQCGEVCGIAHQSVPLIAAARRAKEARDEDSGGY